MTMLFENHELKVYQNGSGEIFVERKDTGVKARITPTNNGLNITAHDNLITPTAVNGLMAVKIWGNVHDATRQSIDSLITRDPVYADPAFSDMDQDW